MNSLNKEENTTKCGGRPGVSERQKRTEMKHLLTPKCCCPDALSLLLLTCKKSRGVCNKGTMKEKKKLQSFRSCPV